MVQQVRRLAGCPLLALVLLQRLAQLASLLAHLLAQQLWVGQQARGPRGLALWPGVGGKKAQWQLVSVIWA